MIKTEILQQQSNDMKLLNSDMLIQEQLNYMLYKNVAENSDDDKAADDSKNDQFFDSNMSNMMIQLIVNFSKIFKKCDNQKFTRFSLNYHKQMKILEHIDDKMNVTSKHFVEMQSKAFMMTQNIIKQQEIMKLIKTEIHIKMSSMSVNVLTQIKAEKILEINFKQFFLFENSEHKIRLNS